MSEPVHRLHTLPEQFYSNETGAPFDRCFDCGNPTAACEDGNLIQTAYAKGEGLVRACMSHQGVGFEAEKWREVSRIYRRTMGLALERKSGLAEMKNGSGKMTGRPQMNTAEALEAGENGTVLSDLDFARMLRCRVRYFTDGGGDWQQGVCERSVRGGAGTFFGEAQGRGAEVAGQWGSCGRWAVEHKRS